MSKVVKGMVVVAAVSLAGCAGVAQRQAETGGANFKSAADEMQACENLIYYSSEYDRRRALDCANVLDIWR